MTSITSNLSCLNAVKRRATNRPPVPSMAIVSASFDRSGSIATMGQAPKNALCSFVTDRKADATNNNSKITVTITTFDDRVERIFDNEPIENVHMTEQEARNFVRPRGTTRLIATAIEEVARLRKAFTKLKADNPDTTVTALYLLFTDGFDNESRPLTARDLNDAIRAAKSEGITCIFAGVDQDAITNGAQYGFTPDTCLTMSSAPQTAAIGLRSCSQAISRAVSGAPVGFTQLERSSSQNVDNLTPPTLPALQQRFHTMPTIPSTTEDDIFFFIMPPPPRITRS